MAAENGWQPASGSQLALAPVVAPGVASWPWRMASLQRSAGVAPSAAAASARRCARCWIQLKAFRHSIQWLMLLFWWYIPIVVRDTFVFCLFPFIIQYSIISLTLRYSYIWYSLWSIVMYFQRAFRVGLLKHCLFYCVWLTVTLASADSCVEGSSCVWY